MLAAFPNILVLTTPLSAYYLSLSYSFVLHCIDLACMYSKFRLQGTYPTSRQHIQIIMCVCLQQHESCVSADIFTGKFFVLLTVNFSIFIPVINQLDAQNLFHNKFISCLYMFRVAVLIIRRSKLYYTASGIVKIPNL